MENKKILVNYVLVLSAILVVLLLVIFIISSRFNQSNKSNQSHLPYPTPTSYLLNYKSQKTPSAFISPSSSSPSLSLIPALSFTGVKEVEVDPQLAVETNQSFELKKQLPLKRGNLKIDFDYEKEAFVISPINSQISISDQEKEEFFNWLKENYPNLNQEKIIFSSASFVSPSPKKPHINITPIIIPSLSPSVSPEEQKNYLSVLVDLLRIIYNQPNSQANISPYPNPSLTLPSDQTGAGFSQVNYTPPQTQYPYIYYPQRDGPFDNYPLPDGCTIRKAGCGPTTVAMIAASYKDRSVNPITIVNQYGSRVGCNGSSYLDAMNVLRSYGINVGSLIFTTSYNQGKKAEEVAPIFKNYLNAGQTIFVLANFRSDGGGHYFWIIDVDEKNNLWAFDPYYGRYQIPYNENSRYPYPLYRLAFPVSP